MSLAVEKLAALLDVSFQPGVFVSFGQCDWHPVVDRLDNLVGVAGDVVTVSRWSTFVPQDSQRSASANGVRSS